MIREREIVFCGGGIVVFDGKYVIVVCDSSSEYLNEST